MNKITISAVLLSLTLAVTSCGTEESPDMQTEPVTQTEITTGTAVETEITTEADTITEAEILTETEDSPISVEYEQITQDEAKRIMDEETDFIILDVRTETEFAEGHILGAMLIADYEITERAAAELPDKSQLILVYCRSGGRSKKASAALASLGYTNVKEFGGIMNWTYETTVD